MCLCGFVRRRKREKEISGLKKRERKLSKEFCHSMCVCVCVYAEREREREREEREEASYFVSHPGNKKPTSSLEAGALLVKSSSDYGMRQ